MAIENLPIPAENATITRGQIYQLTGLTEATRYKFIVTSTKCPHVVIAKDEALEQVEAEGYLSGRAFYFVTEGGQTNAYLRIDALEGAEITLTMKADQIPAPEEATLPADLSPDKWYSIGDLVADTGYELKVSAEAPVTVFVKTGDTIADAIEEPPFVTAAGTTRFTSTGTKAWVYVDGAVKANVDIVAAQGIDPASDQTISGAWSFTNTAGLVLGNEVPLVLGQGDDAVKIHGDGNGAAVIEGTDASHMDVAIPVKFQGSTTFDDSISFVATTGEKMKCILFGKESGPTRCILYEESNGFLSITDPNNVNNKTLTIDGAGDLWVYKNENHNGVVTFNSQTRMHGTIDVGGVMTFRKTPNANSGINIPLAVGAVTDTAAVNRFYALGLAGAMSALVQPIYLNSSSITVAGSISKASNGTLAGLTQRFSVGAASAGSNAYGSAVIPLIGPNGQFNYSSVCGFSLAVNATAFAKFTFGIGRGSKTNRTGLTMDSYSMIPGNELAANYGEIIDVTINTPYDTVRKGYEIRVREIFYVSSVGHWQVKTTTVFLPVGHNELMPNGLNRLIYMQSGPPSIEVREEKAALYMELGGGSTNTLIKIASLRGFFTFEAGTGVSTLIIDARNEKTYALSADAGTGTRHLYANGLTNPTYHALEAMAVNAIESEETADFEDINIPL